MNNALRRGRSTVFRPGDRGDPRSRADNSLLQTALPPRFGRIHQLVHELDHLLDRGRGLLERLAAPMETVTGHRPRRMTATTCASSFRRTTSASRGSVCGSSTTNLSPPRRATMSLTRRLFRMACAVSTRTGRRSRVRTGRYGTSDFRTRSRQCRAFSRMTDSSSVVGRRCWSSLLPSTHTSVTSEALAE
jgi:hypothetical protein